MIGIGRGGLVALAAALRQGRLAPPWSEHELAAFAPKPERAPLGAWLAGLQAQGMAPRHIAVVVEAIAAERAAAQAMSDRIALVWSPDELDEADLRDAAVVVKELLGEARSEVLVLSYVVDEGDKARALFGELAAKMDADPALRVCIATNLPRPFGDETSEAKALVREAARRWRDKVWPGARLPELYYDPRALSVEWSARASLHAKVVVVDRRRTLVTSANFTEAAHERNIECGVLIDDAAVAMRMTRQVEQLIARGLLAPLEA